MKRTTFALPGTKISLGREVLEDGDEVRRYRVGARGSYELPPSYQFALVV